MTRVPYPNSQRRVYSTSINTVSVYPRITAARYPAPALPWRMLVAVLFLASLLILPVLILTIGYAYLLASDRIFPGVSVAGTSLGGLTRTEAEHRLDAFWNGSRTLQVSDGSHTWEVAPIELGLWVDPHATIESAYQIGRGPDGAKELTSLLAGGKGTVSPVVVYSPAVSRDRLTRFAPLVELPAHNATIQLKNGQIIAVPGQNGLTLNFDETIRQASAHPDAILSSGKFALVTQQVAPRVPDAAPLIQRLEDALNHPLTVQAYDPINDETIEWAIPREVFINWVTVDSQGDELEFGLDSSHLSAYLDEWKATLAPTRTLEPFTPPLELTSYWMSGQPVTVLIHRLPTTYTVQPGDNMVRVGFKVGMPYWKIEQANPGIDHENLRAGQILNIPSPNDMLPLPVVRGKRIVISISQQHMWTYENGSLRREYVVSTGIDSSPTYPGVYQVRTHDPNAYASVWDLEMPYFMGIYEGWPGFMNGIHGLPMLSSGVRLWGNVLGSKASYGCIILGMEESEDLYNWAEEGVIVEIQP